MEKPQLQPEHQWLARLAGEWSFEHEAAEPGQPPQTFRGTERVRSLDGTWIVGEAEGESPGGGGRSIMTLGYDPARGRVVGTFISGMMSHLWVYDGAFDPTGRTITLDTEGPSFDEGGGMARYQDVIELVNDDERRLRSRVLRDGRWQEFMVATYRRRA